MSVQELDTGELDEKWGPKELGEYAKRLLSEAQKLGEDSIVAARQKAVHTFRAGRALYMVNQKMRGKPGGFKGWSEKEGIPRSTANAAISLFKKAKSEDQVMGLSIMEAKVKFQVNKPRKSKSPSERFDLIVRNLRTAIRDLKKQFRDMVVTEEEFHQWSARIAETRELFDEARDFQHRARVRVKRPVPAEVAV